MNLRGILVTAPAAFPSGKFNPGIPLPAAASPSLTGTLFHTRSQRPRHRPGPGTIRVGPAQAVVDSQGVTDGPSFSDPSLPASVDGRASESRGPTSSLGKVRRYECSS